MSSAGISEHRSWKAAMWRGFNKACPACGSAPLFVSYVGVKDTCPSCSTELHHHRADDAPPYLTIMIVGHVIGPLVVLLEKLASPDLWLQFALWIPATLFGSLWLLPKVKGAIIGLQWANRMHGFGKSASTVD
jgi:uncharacterized protein (DUF983 family)